MSSATLNRPSGNGSSNARSTRFGDFTSTAGRSNPDDRISQGSSLGQTLGNSAWQASGSIWGNNTIGSGLSNGKRDTSRSRVTDDNGFPATSGSGALAASSEADTWVSRNGHWNMDTTSPTMSAAATTSPIRHRGSGPLMLSDTSPYLSGARPAIGSGSGLNGNRTPGKSILDPDSIAFKYPFQKTSSFPFTDDKENVNQLNGLNQAMESLGFDQRGLRTNSSTSRDTSGPPSRHSESGSNGTANGSFFSNGQYSAFTHTPNNSVQLPRPSTQGRTPSFPSSASGRSYTDLTSHLADTEVNQTRFRDTQNVFEGSNDQSYPSPGLTGYTSQLSQNGSSTMWNQGLVSSSKGLNNYLSENQTEGAFFEHFASNKVARFSDRGSASSADDYRRQPRSPGFYQVNDTASAESDSSYPRAMRSQNVQELERGLSRLQFVPPPHYFPPQILYSPQFQGQYPPHAYDYPPQHNFRLNPHQYGYQMPAPPYTPAVVVPRGPKEHDEGLGVRSLLLEEFRCNSKSNRRYELKDIYNHVVEFSGDQHGSRFIQQKLETANSDEKDQIFREIQSNALQLMTDVFGNYVIQKLFEHGNQVQKRLLAEQMKNHVNELSVQMYGCRVVQKALEHVLADQQAELVRELQQDILRCVKDQNGNHVVQKAIERVPAEDIRFIIDAFKGQVHTLATHPYGCRVIQRMLEYCSEKDQAGILEELHACAQMLITDQYGNYVMQHVIAHGKPEDRAKIIRIVTAQLLTLSKHKFASNVVEKTIQFGSIEQRRAIVAQLTALHSDGSSPLQLMMKDQYGNYVIQKLLGQLKGTERECFVEDIRPQLLLVKKYSYGKQITAIEKLISTDTSPSSSSHDTNPNMTTSAATRTLPLDINSPAATPVLTMEQNSPESSSLPSTNASTVDGPTQQGAAKSGAVDRGMPEVRIETVQ